MGKGQNRWNNIDHGLIIVENGWWVYRLIILLLFYFFVCLKFSIKTGMVGFLSVCFSFC